jgi:hypothetical protein
MKPFMLAALGTIAGFAAGAGFVQTFKAQATPAGLRNLRD